MATSRVQSAIVLCLLAIAVNWVSSTSAAGNRLPYSLPQHVQNTTGLLGLLASVDKAMWPYELPKEAFLADGGALLKEQIALEINIAATQGQQVIKSIFKKGVQSTTPAATSNVPPTTSILPSSTPGASSTPAAIETLTPVPSTPPATSPEGTTPPPTTPQASTPAPTTPAPNTTTPASTSTFPQPACVNRTGYIRLLRAASGPAEYASRVLGNGGAQYVSTTTLADRLLVKFNNCSANASLPVVSLLQQNTNVAADLPFTGAIQGRDNTSPNLAVGNYNYLYFGNTAETPPGSPPVIGDNSYIRVIPRSLTIESTLWVFAPNDTFIARWVNTDGSTPTVFYWTQSGGMYMGGDQQAFFNRYPATVTPFTPKFEDA
uniref:Putative extracellular protein CSOL_087 n=1 Tax=Pseudococcomyxa simplex TaxID=464287 RepID=A0A7L9QEI6_9CHLO|nr:putative extracellular protein CSOL_087 [Pseudococcomyxa simplex]